MSHNNTHFNPDTAQTFTLGIKAKGSNQQPTIVTMLGNDEKHAMKRLRSQIREENESALMEIVVFPTTQ